MPNRRATAAASFAATLAISLYACDTDQQPIDQQPIGDVPPAEEEARPLDRDPLSEAEVTEFETLLPLGAEDVGERIEVEGTVVGEPIDQGFWVATDDGTAIFVRSDQPVDPGTSVTDMDFFGEVRSASAAETADWQEQANLQAEDDFAGWDVRRDLYIDATVSPPAGRPGGQAPGARQP